MNALAPTIVRRRGFAVPQGLAGPVAAVLAAAAVAVVVAGRTDAGPSVYLMNLVGQAAVYGLLAVALDLIWGYAGILSLGHGLYFAIGGYLIAMHLVTVAFHTSGTPPDFMLFMGWTELPVYYAGMDMLGYSAALILLLPALVAFLFGLVSFRSRVTGVYFAIITQALVYVAMLLFFRNDTGFGGNNGMTGFTHIAGQPLSERGTVAVLCALSLLAAAAALFGLDRLVRSRFGHMLVAVRDDEARLRFLGYDTLWIKLAVWCLSAVLAAVAGALYVPQVGIVNPRVLSPELSLEIAVWVAIGGRGTLVGAFLGAVVITTLKFLLTAWIPVLWPFVLSALVLVVVITLPNGFLDAGGALARLRRRAAGGEGRA
ncbi:urea ABC transporter permease subunit UrtC [Azospirillum sp. RWY-5-1]|uniref:Urea ABC transporter permease subunit UrtC n=1 Tax=Azospirillum oleiclasticum TaxID=2735135 RepID=A0ABX2TFV6_9PROT|nr:urea ABC transporter permease subunit UrtC [Azospirillum oleiclasticum]NYZ14429.1 urea ABC transporter permease subunit UrtC [Azospirillum oleiclasticum]NYZ23219.1 urea ABC transporter permease subunit UrtC [Azospirillum oleiclasticum]